ncbi:MAG: hypothetical protein JW808_08085 [Victivallales bacterium]|nr:hypothetical protein [Victivallales bacterium]
MEKEKKSLLIGCGCGTLSFIGFFVLSYAACFGICAFLWNVADVRHSFVRGPSVLVWGGIVSFFVALVAGALLFFIAKRVAGKHQNCI